MYWGTCLHLPQYTTIRKTEVIRSCGQPPQPELCLQVRFMWQEKSLEWLWVLEYDVRLLGHWGSFLNAAMHIAAQAKAQVTSNLCHFHMQAQVCEDRRRAVPCPLHPGRHVFGMPRSMRVSKTSQQSGRTQHTNVVYIYAARQAVASSNIHGVRQKPHPATSWHFPSPLQGYLCMICLDGAEQSRSSASGMSLKGAAADLLSWAGLCGPGTSQCKGASVGRTCEWGPGRSGAVRWGEQGRAVG